MPRELIELPPAVARSAAVRMLFCLVLSACSSDKIDLPPSIYVPPSPPTQDAVVRGLKTVASDAKLAAPLEVSAARPTEHGPGRYLVCLKGTLPAVVNANPTTDNT